MIVKIIHNITCYSNHKITIKFMYNDHDKFKFSIYYFVL